MAQLFLLCPIGLFTVSCKHSYANNDKDKVSEFVNRFADSLLYDASSKSKYANYVMNKVQAKYPNGFKGFSSDSVLLDVAKIGSNCIHDVPGLKFNTQSHFFEEIMRGSFSESSFYQDMKEQYRVPYCDCVIAEYIKLYPNGVIINPRDTAKNDIIKKDCIKKVGLNN